ncbi:hypothetical protein HK405_014667 [Cladochytrium tenue]|nr:hypothetical protein HK405_014667 [Cladochytrium tenue]
MDAATPHAVIAPAAEGHTDFSASRDELLEAKLAAIESLLKRRTAVAIWLSGLSLDSLEALLPRNKAALKLLEVFAEGAYDNEQRKWHEEELRRQDDERRRQEAREQRLNVILRAIEDATDLSEALRKDLTKLFIHGVNELVIGVDFRPPYLEDAVKARSLLPTSFGDEIKAIYAKYDIFSSSTMHPLDSARPLIKVKSSRWDLADLTKNNIVWSPNLDITADLPNTMDKFMISVVDAKLFEMSQQAKTSPSSQHAEKNLTCCTAAFGSQAAATTAM